MSTKVAHWKYHRLGDVCSIIGGGTPDKSNHQYYTGDIPWATVRDLKGESIFETEFKITPDALKNSSANIVKTGNTIIATRVGLGKVSIAAREMAINQDLKGVIPRNTKLIVNKFLFRWLCSIAQKIIDKGVGATVKGVKLDFVKSLEIPLPSTEEQRRIVAILDDAFERIDKAIADTEKNIANVNELIERTISDAVFGEPDKKSLDILQVKNLADSAKGAIRTGPFGSQLLHSEFVDSGIAVLGIDNAVQNEFKWGKNRFITHKKYKKLSRYTVHPGDVLITIMGTCGRCAVVPNDIPTAINTKHLCCITLNKNKCTPEFLHDYFLYHPIAKNYLAAKAKGAIMAGLNMEIIKLMPVLLPSLPRQKSITQDVANLSGQKQALITTYQNKLTSLRSLKQSLLAAAFSGELTADFNPDALEL